MNTQEVMTTIDTKTSLGIYSMSAPSSAVSSSKTTALESPQPTSSDANLSSSATTRKEVTNENEASTSPARKPILVTGLPGNNRRQMNGEWEEEGNTYDDEMPRIPITTPHSVSKIKSSSPRINNGVNLGLPKRRNPATKGIT